MCGVTQRCDPQISGTPETCINKSAVMLQGVPKEYMKENLKILSHSLSSVGQVTQEVLLLTYYSFKT